MKRFLLGALAISALAAPAHAGTAADLILLPAPAPIAAPPRVLRAEWELTLRQGGGFIQVSCSSNGATSLGSVSHAESSVFQAVRVAPPASPWDGYQSNEKPQGFSVGVTLFSAGNRSVPVTAGQLLGGSANCPAAAILDGKRIMQQQAAGVTK